MKPKESIFETLRMIARDTSAKQRISVSAAIVKNNKIISIGINDFNKTDAFQNKFSRNPEIVFPHAEVSAIKNAFKCIDLYTMRKCVIYVCRMKFDSTHKIKLIQGVAKPCDACMKAIKTFELKGVIYTLDESDNRKYEVISFI
jgi:tRNA(Arg) A34 adenosine deaminase TadA